MTSAAAESDPLSPPATVSTERHLWSLQNLQRSGAIEFTLVDVPNGPREDESWTSTITSELACSLRHYMRWIAENFSQVCQRQNLGTGSGAMVLCLRKDKAQSSRCGKLPSSASPKTHLICVWP